MVDVNDVNYIGHEQHGSVVRGGKMTLDKIVDEALAEIRRRRIESLRRLAKLAFNGAAATLKVASSLAVIVVGLRAVGVL